MTNTNETAQDAPRMAEADRDAPILRRKGFYIEAWRGLDCVAWRYVTRPATVVRAAQGFAADHGADRMYVRWTGDRRGVAADWTQGAGWRRCDDVALLAVLVDEGLIDAPGGPGDASRTRCNLCGSLVGNHHAEGCPGAIVEGRIVGPTR